MGVIISTQRDEGASTGTDISTPEVNPAWSRRLAAEMTAAFFDNDRHSQCIRNATREWIAEQRKNGYEDSPDQDKAGSGLVLLLLVGALLFAAFPWVMGWR